MTVKEQIARLRHELEELERQVDAAEADGVDADDEAELDAWIERNREALNASIRAGREAEARGDFIEGTADELLDHFLTKARQTAASS